MPIKVSKDWGYGFCVQLYICDTKGWVHQMGISLTSHKHVQAGMFLALVPYAARARKGLKLNFVLGVSLYFPFHLPWFEDAT